jgi:hypothetical protein
MLLYTAALAQEEPREPDLYREEAQDAHYHGALGA